MKKILSVLMAATISFSSLGLALGTTLPASAATKQKYKGVTLTVLTHWTNLTNSKKTGWLDKFAAHFKRETGATVKYQAITDYTTVTTRLSGGDYGDVLDIPTSVAVAELPSFFAAIGNSKDKDLKNIYYNYQDAIKQKDGSYKAYGLSYGLSLVGAVYNKAAFKKAGISKFPTKLKDLYTDCEKLKAKGIVPIAINFKDKWPLSSAFDAMPEYCSHDGNWQNTVYKTTDLFSSGKPYGTALNVLNKIVSSGWVEKDLASTNWEQSKNDLGTGKDGMMFLGFWAVPQMQGAATAAGKKASDIGFAPIPTDNSGKLYTYASQDYMMGISKRTKHYAAARQYLMEFINSSFASSQGFAPIIKGKKSSNKLINEFLSSGVTEITGVPGKTGKEYSNMTKIGNEAGIDFWGGVYLQNAVVASQEGTFSSYIKQLNGKWNAAKKKLGF